MKCEQCGKEHDGTFGSGRFCCRSCSNKYVALHQSPEAKARKVAKGKNNLIHNRRVRKIKEESTDSNTRYVCLCGREFNSQRSLGGHKSHCPIYSGDNYDRTKHGVESLIRYNDRRRIPIESILSNEVKNYSPTRFKWRLIEEGYKELRCEKCGLSEWLGKEIPIELHHINGDNSDNTLENLQILCPNCHSFTDNYRWKKKFNR